MGLRRLPLTFMLLEILDVVGISGVGKVADVAGDCRCSLVVNCARFSYLFAIILKKSVHSCKRCSAFFFILSAGLHRAVSISPSKKFGAGRGRVIGSSAACSR